MKKEERECGHGLRATVTCVGKGNRELGGRNELRGKQKTSGFRMGRNLGSFTKNQSSGGG